MGGIPRRCVAAALTALVLLPWYRLVAIRGTGPAVEQTLRLGELYYANLWLSSALSLAAAVILSWLLRPGSLNAVRRRAEGALCRATAGRFALGLGAVATSLSLWTSAVVLDRKPALLDGVAQLVQARYLAAGALAGPPLEDPEFWQFQFMVLTERGWLPQYPPGFALMLSLGERVGVAWMVGPLLLGFSIFLTSLIAERIFPTDRSLARIGGTLAALSPLVTFHAAAYMSHVLALALTVVAVYASLEAMRGSWRWSLMCGAALGALFITRPYTALVLGFFATAVVWLCAPERAKLTRSEWLARVAGVSAGSAPFITGLLLYNRHFFASPLRFGYDAAEGPGHGLGFHIDPWGNPYGLREALGHTSADLQGLSVELLQAPIPVVLLVALYLLLARRVGVGVSLAAAWALLPVLAHALYWHHDLFMGPRLLYEAVPGWCFLVAAAVLAATRAVPEQGLGLGRVRLLSRSGVSAALAAALLLAVVYAGPRKLASFGREGARSGMTLAAPAVERATLVFVHGSWEDRVAARLAGLGMRVDSIRSALAHNSTCRLELYLEGLERVATSEDPTAAPELRLAFEESGGPPLRELVMPSGSVIRAHENETLDPICERQAASDFAGALGLPPFLWQGDLPGLGSSGALFVRDLGPRANQRLVDRFPEREPSVLIRRDGVIRLLPYGTGMAELWSERPT